MCLFQVVKLSRSLNPRVRFAFGNVSRTGGAGQFVNFLADSLSGDKQCQVLWKYQTKCLWDQKEYITNTEYKITKYVT